MTERSVDARIAALARRLRWKHVAAGRRGGPQPSRRLGESGEFDSFRPYQPGDEVRTIDAKIWSRLRQRMVRVTREDSALPVTILVDRSASMVGGDERDAAVPLAVTFFAALARESGDACRVFTFADGTSTRWELPRPLTLAGVTSKLAGLPTGDRAGFAAAFRRLPPDPAGRGVVVVISDAFGVENPVLELGPLARLGVPCWLAPLESSEWNPPATGSTRFVSRETEPIWSGHVDATRIEAYRAALGRFHDGLRRHLRSLGGAFVGIEAASTVESLAAALRREGELVG